MATVAGKNITYEWVSETDSNGQFYTIRVTNNSSRDMKRVFITWKEYGADLAFIDIAAGATGDIGRHDYNFWRGFQPETKATLRWDETVSYAHTEAAVEQN